MLVSQNSRQIALALLIGLVGALGFGVGLKAGHAASVAELSLGDRILLTIAATANPDVEFTADDMAELRDREDFYIDEEEGLYLYSYPVEIAGFESSAYYRISSPTQFKKPKAEEDWLRLTDRAPGGASVWFRSVARSGAEPYNEVQASAKKGKLVLTTSMRRPPNEPREQAQAAIEKDFQLLLDMGKKYGILSRLVIARLGPDSDEGERLDDDALVNVLGNGQEENRVSFRVHALDDKGAVDRNVAYFSIKVTGMLAPYARIDGAAYNAEKAQFEVR